MSGMRRVYDPRLATVGLGSSRWRGSRRVGSPLGWLSMVVDEVGGGCTFFGGGLLTRRLSTYSVGELREPYNASFSQAAVPDRPVRGNDMRGRGCREGRMHSLRGGSADPQAFKLWCG
jgi:hypothetical protein